ncbi:Uma2 family endonuclease [Candidatus Poribacteria bacterium]|nr:Uma2 family endonuclease [Candidatus Poribacteria bacterium]
MQKKIQSAPTIFYPESDGKPMAETDKHRDLMIDFIQMLKHHYRNENDVYVSGNLLIYYEEGNPRKSISPDVFVVFGVAKKQRNTYLTWKETHTPDFVLEVASPSTFSKDMGRKKDLYASVFEVKEYYIYDPLGEIVPSFIGYRLTDGIYQEINFVNERLPSAVLGLELGEHGNELRLYDPKTSQWLQTPPERAENAEIRAENAETRAQEEASARRNAETRAENAEAALAKALAALERLKAEENN